MSASAHTPPARVHYAWVIALVTFVVLLITAGVRATPGVLMVPLETEFGWSRAAISAPIAINIALFGLIGPFAASVMDRWGLRRVDPRRAGAAHRCRSRSPPGCSTQWQLTLLWGVLVGTGTGVTSMVLAAVVATRWFDERRGAGARRAVGRQRHRPAGVPAAAGRPGRAPRLARGDAGRGGGGRGRVRASCWCSCAIARRISGCGPTASAAGRAGARRRSRWRRSPRCALAARTPAFWVLAGTFFVCGASTNGLIGTHLIAACHDFGIPQVRSAQLLAVMGIFDIVGTTASGWLTDRYSSRHSAVRLLHAARAVAALPAVDAARRRRRPRLVRDLLRPRLDRHRAADRPADEPRPSAARTPA